MFWVCYCWHQHHHDDNTEAHFGAATCVSQCSTAVNIRFSVYTYTHDTANDPFDVHSDSYGALNIHNLHHVQWELAMCLRLLCV